MSEDRRVAQALTLLARELHELHKALPVLRRIDEIERKFMATAKELVAELDVIKANQAKTLGEIAEAQRQQALAINRITELENIISAGVGSPITQELVDKVAEVKAQSIAVDEAFPDVSTSGPL